MEIGQTSWRLLMGANALLLCEAIVMAFTYSMIEGLTHMHLVRDASDTVPGTVV